MKSNKHYFVYKTTNILNGKIYIGCHITSDINDGYMGSGKHLCLSIKKYGVENFKREILSFHDTKEEMYLEEARLVDNNFILREDTYNITVGGLIPPDQTGKIMSEEQKRKISQSNKGKVISQEMREHLSKLNKGKKSSDETKKKLSIAAKARNCIPPSAKGRKRSEEFKQKIRDAFKENPPQGMKGKTHSQEAKERMRLKAIEREARKKLKLSQERQL
jgi:group I intron endonuclease